MPITTNCILYSKYLSLCGLDVRLCISMHGMKMFIVFSSLFCTDSFTYTFSFGWQTYLPHVSIYPHYLVVLMISLDVFCASTDTEPFSITLPSHLSTLSMALFFLHSKIRVFDLKIVKILVHKQINWKAELKPVRFCNRNNKNKPSDENVEGKKPQSKLNKIVSHGNKIGEFWEYFVCRLLIKCIKFYFSKVSQPRKHIIP